MKQLRIKNLCSFVEFALPLWLRNKSISKKTHLKDGIY